MAYRVELLRAAERDLDDLDPPVARRIVQFRHQRVAALDDPRSIGESRKGTRLGDLWRYRVDDYRVIVDVQDDLVLVLVARISHRRQVYR